MTQNISFREAAQRWLDLKRAFISAGTYNDYRHYMKYICQLFGDMPVSDITIDHVREYQRARMRKGTRYIPTERVRLKTDGTIPATAGPSLLNHEIGTVRQVLEEVGVWANIAPRYKPLPVPKFGPGRALTREEAERFFAAIRNKVGKRHEVAFCASLISINTGAGPGEVRNLQLRDIDISNRLIYVRRGVKNDYRVRHLDLNDEALDAVQRLLARAKKKGSHLPEHYLLPANKKSSEGKHAKFTCDPTRPAESWKRAWYSWCESAGLKGLRRYDLRHTALTNLYENPAVPERAIIEIAGWSSPQMAARYAHIRRETKRNALMSLPRVVPETVQSTAAKTSKANSNGTVTMLTVLR